MQRPCILSATKRVEFIDGRKYTAVTFLDNTCLGPVGHQVSAPGIGTTAFNQKGEMVGAYEQSNLVDSSSAIRPIYYPGSRESVIA